MSKTRVILRSLLSVMVVYRDGEITLSTGNPGNEVESFRSPNQSITQSAIITNHRHFGSNDDDCFSISSESLVNLVIGLGPFSIKTKIDKFSKNTHWVKLKQRAAFQ